MFPLTAGHCAPVGATVRGTDRAFGTVAHSRWTARDTALIREYASDDAYQIVVDPTTRRSPGKVAGIYPGGPRTTGWTEGGVFLTSTWHGMPADCPRPQQPVRAAVVATRSHAPPSTSSTPVNTNPSNPSSTRPNAVSATIT
jgi:hypothetical protein